MRKILIAALAALMITLSSAASLKRGLAQVNEDAQNIAEPEEMELAEEGWFKY
jgi:hypothetical protein